MNRRLWVHFTVVLSLTLLVVLILLSILAQLQTLSNSVVAAPPVFYLQSPEDDKSSSSQQIISIPTYYINLAEDVDRRAYMDYTFRPMVVNASDNFIRVEALKLTDLDLLLKHLDPKQAPERDVLFKRKHFEVYDRFKALPGQLGNTFSHLEAIRLAYKNGDQVCLILEDDATDQLKHFWPVPISELIRIASHAYPEWGAIRLQWNDYESKVKKLHDQWKNELSEWLAQGLERHALWRDTRSYWDGSSASKPPIFMRYGSGWGNVATIFSRKGMKTLLDEHWVKELDQGNVWRCVPSRSCTADLSFWPGLDQQGAPVLISTPPYFTYRLAEIQTKHIRQGQKHSDHRLLHLQSVSRAYQWALEFEEFYKPGGMEGMPWSFVWNVNETKKS